MMNKLWMEAKNRWQTLTAAQKRNAILAGLGMVFSLLLFGLTFSPSRQTNLLNSPLYYVGVFVKLGGVLLLIVGSGVVLKRWQRSRSQGAALRNLSVIESVRLSPRQALHLVRVGNQQFLVGATDQAVSLISNVEMTPETAAAETAQPVMDFTSLFRSAAGRLPLEVHPADGKKR